MPLLASTSTALPYIDQTPSNEARNAADALVQEALLAQDTPTTHPKLPALPEARFSAAVELEHARIAGGEARQGGIDLSRYEALDAPAQGDVTAWRTALQKAYASAEYLRGREVNLGLLETYGKNAWLVGNSQLEDVLKPLEVEVEEAKLELEALEQARRAAQANAAGEMQGLEDGWRKGMGRMIETQAAAEGLRQQILESKRNGGL